MAPIVTRYPLDPTGTSMNNLVANESHSLGSRTIRAFPTNYGGFFTESVVVKEKSTQRELDKNIDYYCSQIYDIPTAKYGKEICSVIVITNSSISSEVQVTYQALGGPWSTSQQAIVNMFNSVDHDTRPVKWGDILNKPSEFNPAHHLHDLGDLYGFEYVVAELERVRQSILVGDSASHDEIYAYIDKFLAELNTKYDDFINGLSELLNGHITDKNNPHNVTAEQINAYTKEQTNKLVNDTKAEITVNINQVENTLNATYIQHSNNEDNPHEVTASQVGTYTSDEIDLKIDDVNNKLSKVTEEAVINTTPANPIELRIVSNRLEAKIDGSWKVVWPPLWQ